MRETVFRERAWIYICFIFVAVVAVGCRASGTLSKRPAKPPVGLPAMEILYTRTNPPRWQICVLHLTSHKVDVLLDSGKAKQLGSMIGSSVFSPNGQYVLFTGWPARLPDKAMTEYRGCDEVSDLWILDRRTKAVRRLTTDYQGYTDLHWSSDGRYVSAHGLGGWTTPDTPPTEAGGRRDTLYVWDTRTGHRTSVLGNANREQWMPGGDRLLALANDWQLYLWDEGTRRLIASAVDDNMFWSKDGNMLFFRRHSSDQIWHAPPSGKPVTVASGHLLAKLKTYFGPIYQSPDGSRSLVVIFSDKYREPPYKTWLTVTSANSGKAARIALNDNVEILGWSQDGATIVVLNRTAQQPDRILAVSADTGSIRDLGTLPTSAALGTPDYWDWRLTNAASLGNP